MHAGALEEAMEALMKLKKMFSLNEIAVIDLPPAIITHAGRYDCCWLFLR
jgi:hypothetical protein